MSVILGRGVVQVSTDGGGQAGDREACSVFLMQPHGSTARWVISVRAHTSEGDFELGKITTCPPRDNSSPSRCVLIATCPGAVDWTLVVYPAQIDGAAQADDQCSLALQAGKPAPNALPGVVRPGERAKIYSAGDAASPPFSGNVNILPGEVVRGWSAFTSVATGNVTIVGIPNGNPIPLPSGGSMTGNGGPGFEGPLQFQFVNVTGYAIEVGESA